MTTPHPPADFTVRRARTDDVTAIRELLGSYKGILLDKPDVTLFEDIQEFWVAEHDGDGRIVGCGALHVFWLDLAEVRTLAVDPECRGMGIGARILDKLVRTAARIGVRRLFCLTFEVDFFAAHGFSEISGVPVPPQIEAELSLSADGGVAEFLDLEQVKPNTLGNTRMLRIL
ncbi:MAG: amino-acid N-acetyltransferase [Catenulispora sp.]|nr:amino-acid N-acetyltransferase [Catenulispora sp.]